METKKKIRKEILAKRDTLTESQRESMSQEIFHRLTQLPEFENAGQILLFAGYGSEPDTISWMKSCMQNGKKVFCPTVCGEVMEFYEVKDVSELQIGYKGIPEPVPMQETKYVPGAHDLMILPGVAFDHEGNRIGYGKGFYDRYLASGYSGEKLAVAFSLQMVENERMPAEMTDQRIGCIVTEKEIIRI